MKALRETASISLRRALLPAAVFCTLLTGATEAHAATLVVDRDKAQCPNAPYESIQQAVKSQRPGTSRPHA